MRRLCTAILVAFAASWAWGDSTTARMNLTQPTVGSANWGGKINGDMQVIDSTAASQFVPNTFTSTNTFSGYTQFSSTVNWPSLPTASATKFLAINASSNTIVATAVSSTTLPTDTAYLDQSQNWTAQQTFGSSVTVTSPSGVKVTYNATVGSATVTNLTTNAVVKTDGSSNLTASNTLGSAGNPITISSNTIIPGATFYQDGSWAVGGGVGTTGQVLKSNAGGTPPTWTTLSASAGGSNTQVQYNSANALAGDSKFIDSGSSLTVNESIGFNSTSSTFTLAMPLSTSTVSAAVGTVGQALISQGPGLAPSWAGGRILNVCFSTLSTSSGTATLAFVPTGLQCTITPTVATSSMVVVASGNLRDSNLSTDVSAATLLKDSSNLGNSTKGMCYMIDNAVSISNLDIPCAMATVDVSGNTSSRTYKVGIGGSSAVTTTWNSQSALTTLMVIEIGP